MESPPNPGDIDSWLLATEGEHFEFKAATGNFHFEDAVTYGVALANEGGGRLLLGVTNERPRSVCGSAAFRQPERTRLGLLERLPVTVRVHEVNHPAGRVVVLEFGGRPFGQVVQDPNGIAWSRTGDALAKMTDDRRRQIWAEAGYDFSAKLCSGATFEDFDAAAVETFRRLWVSRLERSGAKPTAARIQALRHSELLADAELAPDGQPTYAALILFGTRRALGKHLGQAEVIFEYRSSEASGPAGARDEFREGFLLCFDRLWEAVNRRNRLQYFQAQMVQTPIPVFAEEPVREVLLNAVSHRDYQLGGSVFVRQFESRLEVDSPGGFPPGVTAENILERNRPRNRLLADALARCGLVERSGQGMDIIFQEAVRHGKQLPEFARTDPYQVGLTLHGTVLDTAFVQFVEAVGRETYETFSTRDWLLLGSVARRETVHAAERPRAVKLVDLGLLERTGRGKFDLPRQYYVHAGRVGEYTRARGLSRETNLQLLMKHVRENPSAKLEDMQQVLPSLSRRQVQGLLDLLRERGWIELRGKAGGGRWYASHSDIPSRGN